MTRFITLTAAAALAVLAIAACGSSTDHRQKTATATQAGLEMASCMRANGVPNFPDPTNNTSGTISVHASGLGNILTVNGVSVNAPAFQSAMARCQEYLPTGHVSTTRFDKIRRGALAMAKCMRSRGVTSFPDPTVSDGPEGLIVTGNLKAAHININAPAFQAALTKCQPLEGLPAPRAG